MTEGRKLFTARQMVALSRYTLSMMLGQQTAFAGARQYYDVLGYRQEITIDDYWMRYDRQDIASRIVDLPAKDTWKNPPKVTEDGNDETAFAKAWADLVREKHIWGYLTRADCLSGVGRYGVLLLGLRTTGDLSSEAKKVAGPDGLLYLRPFSEREAVIKTFVTDQRSPRYGLPETYEIKLDAEKEDKSIVHYSRVLHLAENKGSNEVYGRPRLKPVFNRLDDLIKYVGGNAEATWINMRPGMILRPQEGYTMDRLDAQDIEDELENYVHDIMRIMQLEGIEAQNLAQPSVVDVSPGFESTLALISAAVNMPQRILIGSAGGELAAAKEDMRQWAGTIAARQKTYAEPEILRPLVEQLIVLGVLPEVKRYDVGTQNDDGEWEWPPLHQMTALEEAEIRERNANAVATIANAGAVFPLTGGETRVLLGRPEERPEEPEEEEIIVEPEPPPLLPASVEAVEVAMNNLREGSVDPEDVGAFALATLMELRENRE